MGEKKLDAAAQELHAFTEQPELSPAAQLEADSYVDSAAEQLRDLKAAGFHVPEKAPGSKLDLTDAVSGIEQGFNTEADLAPAEQIQADSYTEPMAEQLQELKDAGIPVPEKAPGGKLDLSDAVSGIEQGFNTEADLAPAGQIEADSYTEPMAEQLQELKDAGIPVPEKAPGGKLDLSDAVSGIEQGFNTEAELSPAGQIEADSYTESMAEQLKEIHELLDK